MICKTCGKEVQRESNGVVLILTGIERSQTDPEKQTLTFRLCGRCVTTLHEQDNANRSIAEIARDTVVAAFGDAVA